MPSFDVVSEIDTHELTNAVDQAVRELTQRFDFKDSGASFELEETTVTMTAPADFQLKQMLEILKLREDMKKKQGTAFSLEEFHNNFLRQGFPPIKIVREAMLGDQSPTL